jgi:hypothetical protein
MNAQQKHQVETEARRDRGAHPERGHGHEDVIRTYLGAMAYAERRRRPPDDDEPRPVDEPVAR